MKTYYAIIEMRVDVKAANMRTAREVAAGNLPGVEVAGCSATKGSYRLKSLKSKVVCVTVDP